MERSFHLKIALHVLFTIGTYARRVQYKTADSLSHAEVRRTLFIPTAGASAFTGHASSTPAGASRQIRAAHMPRVPARRFGPRMQAWSDDASGPSWESDFEKIQAIMNKRAQKVADLKKSAMEPVSDTQVNVRNVLADWYDQTNVKAGQMQTGDADGFAKMLSDHMIIRRMQNHVEKDMVDHHILGLATGSAAGDASEHDIQALASVTLQFELDEDEQLLNIVAEQGFADPVEPGEVPVVWISGIVTKPTLMPKSAESEMKKQMIHGIIDWAKEMGRLVQVTPDNEDLEVFYYSLGFRRIDLFGAKIMVYHEMKYQGIIREDTQRFGLLLGLFQGVTSPMDPFGNGPTS